MTTSDGDESAEDSVIHIVNSEVFDPYIFEPLYKLDQFLKSNRYLFTLIGVFGAIGVYISQINSDVEGLSTSISNFALSSALSILLILGALIIMKSIDEITGEDIELFSRENFGILLFDLFFIILFSVIVAIVSEYNTYWRSIYFVFIFISSPIIAMETLSRSASLFDDYITNDKTISLVLSSGALFVISVCIILYNGSISSDLEKMAGGASTFYDWTAVYVSSIFMFLIAFSMLIGSAGVLNILMNKLYSVVKSVWEKLSTTVSEQVY
jgi:hypothetical protein